MKLTTKGRYAVTAMLDLALNSSQGPVSLGEISERQEISLSYLEQLFAKLRKQELVVSTRGPGGGYRVSRSLDQVAVGQIISAVDEPVDVTNCAGRKNCHNHGRCLTHDLWEALSIQIEDFLNGVSLQDLIEKQSAEKSAEQGSGPAEVGALEVPLKQAKLPPEMLKQRSLLSENRMPDKAGQQRDNRVHDDRLKEAISS